MDTSFARYNLHEAYLLQPDYNLQEYNDIHTQQKVKRNSIRMVCKSVKDY